MADLTSTEPSWFPHSEPTIADEAVDTVNEILNWAQNFAVATAQQALQAIGQQPPIQITIPPYDPAAIDWPEIPTSIPDAPVSNVPDAAFPPVPAEPVLVDVAPLEIPNAPVNGALMPTIATIPLPDPLDALLPAQDELNEVVVPVSPDYVLPSVPTLAQLNIPGEPTLDLPTFNESVMERPIPPDVTFAWSEAAYGSTLLSLMTNRLLEFCAGASTGLTPDVEQAIWSRARERETANTRRQIDEVRRNVAGRGFAVPPGGLQTALDAATQLAIEKDSSLSREVMIKQAELEQENFKFAFTTALGLESKLIDYSNQLMARAFEGATFALKIQVELFNSRVSLYQADAAVFQAKAAVFKIRLEAALAQLDIYKAKLEGQKLIGELNLQQVQVYEAQLKGVLAAVEVYKSQVQAAQVQAEVNKSIVESFKAAVEAYGEQVKAKAVEYEGYASQVKAQANMVEMYAQQVAAYKSETDGYNALVDAKVKSKSFEVKLNQEIPLAIFEKLVAAYGENVRAEAARLKSYVDVFDSEVKSYSAQIDGAAKLVTSQASIASAQATYANASAQIEVARTKMAGDYAMAAAELASANAKAQGQVAGMLAAAAMAQFHMGATISASSAANSSKNYSEQLSQSFNVNQNWSYKGN